MSIHKVLQSRKPAWCNNKPAGH